MSDSRRRELVGLLACLSIHGLVAAWLLSGALGSGGQRVPGAADTETWAFLWGQFWMEHSLLELGQWPMRTTLLDFPTGGVLFLKDPLRLLASVPLQRLMGLPTAYTLTVWAQLVAAGLGTYLLARLLGIGRMVAVAAGLAFLCCPHLLGEVYNGNTEAVNGAWCALWLWGLLAAVRSPSWGRALLAGGLLAGLLLSNQYFGLAMAGATVPVLGVALWRWRDDGVPLGRRLLVVAGVVLLGLVLFAPFAVGLSSSMEAPDQLTFLDSAVPLEPPYTTDLLHLWSPLAVVGPAATAPPFQDLVYPGLLLALLALLAPALGVRGPWRWLWTLLALAFLALALGPVAVLDGRILRWPGGDLAFLPWAWLIPGKPVVGSMTLPHRMAVPAGLFFALGAAWTLQGLALRLAVRGRWLALLAPLVALAAVGEQLLYPPYRVPVATTPVPIPAHACLLAQLPGEGAVLDLPFLMGQNRRLVYLYWQTIHRRPVVASLRHGPPPSVAAEHPWLAALADFQQGEAPLPGGDPAVATWLVDRGFDAVAFHPTHLNPSPHQERALAAWRDTLEQSFGPGLELEGGSALFPLVPSLRRDLELAAASGSCAGVGSR